MTNESANDEQHSALVPGNDEAERMKGLVDGNNDIMQDIDMEEKNESCLGENDEGGEHNEDATPVELQCEEVDMNDPYMDPVELYFYIIYHYIFITSIDILSIFLYTITHDLLSFLAQSLIIL